MSLRSFLHHSHVGLTNTPTAVVCYYPQDMRALSSLDLSRNKIGADGVAFITAALKMHAIEHQGPCIGIRLGDQDQHFLARTLGKAPDNGTALLAFLCTSILTFMVFNLTLRSKIKVFMDRFLSVCRFPEVPSTLVACAGVALCADCPQFLSLLELCSGIEDARFG